MLLPNLWWSKIFGKLVFLACDLVIGVLLLEVLKHLLKSRKEANAEVIDSEAMFYTLFWLFNPIAMNVSTRGNAESVIGALVVLTLYLVLVKRSVVLSGIVYGLAVHVKIYPVVYALALFLFVDSGSSASTGSFRSLLSLKTFFNKQRLTFALTTAATVIGLTGVFYVLFGWTFLYETYLYHLVRKDNRHNFSVFFYHIYLSGSHPVTEQGVNLAQLAFKIFADFGPQLALLLVITFTYYQDITFCVLLQTMTFVAFNKVCTVQYFCWYFSLLPLALPWNGSMSLPTRVLLPIAWAAGQGLWLWFAYRLEFLAENTFFSIWVAGIVFFVINVAIIISLILNHKVTSIPQPAPSIMVAERQRQKKAQ